MNFSKQKYKASSTFKAGTMLILILSGFAITGGIVLFVFGMSWLFMGIYKNETVSDSHVAWGVTMMVIGFYISMLNLLCLSMTAGAVNRKETKRLMLIAIVSIAGFISMPGGITLLFTPTEPEEIKPVRDVIVEEKIPTVIKSQVSEDFKIDHFSNLDLEKQNLKKELLELKEKIDSGEANDFDREAFKIKTKEYNEKYGNKK